MNWGYIRFNFSVVALLCSVSALAASNDFENAYAEMAKGFNDYSKAVKKDRHANPDAYMGSANQNMGSLIEKKRKGFLDSVFNKTYGPDGEVIGKADDPRFAFGEGDVDVSVDSAAPRAPQSSRNTQTPVAAGKPDPKVVTKGPVAPVIVDYQQARAPSSESVSEEKAPVALDGSGIPAEISFEHPAKDE